VRTRRALLAAVILLVILVPIVVAIAAAPRPAPTATPGAASATSAPSQTPVADDSFPPQSPQPSSATGTSSPAALALGDLLRSLRVTPEDRTGYERSLFEHWIDADDDGCDTRREVLIAESLEPVTISGGCGLTGGRWRSLYDGVETRDPATFDVDHVVPLAEAWDSGASGWAPARRRRFANDLEVDWALIAVSAASNRSKGDQDPADWRPQLRDVGCTYAGMWIAVKVRWQLSIDAAERAALASLIAGCDDVVVVPVAS